MLRIRPSNDRITHSRRDIERRREDESITRPSDTNWLQCYISFAVRITKIRGKKTDALHRSLFEAPSSLRRQRAYREAGGT